MFHVFLLCSGLAAFVNVSVGLLLYRGLGLDTTLLYGLSVAIAFLSGMGVSFVLNRRFTYAPSGRTVQSELTDFLVVSLGGLGLTTGLAVLLATTGKGVMLTLTANLLPVETSAHLTAVGLTAIYSFLAHKHISFRKAASLSAVASGKAEITLR